MFLEPLSSCFVGLSTLFLLEYLVLSYRQAFSCQRASFEPSHQRSSFELFHRRHKPYWFSILTESLYKVSGFASLYLFLRPFQKSKKKNIVGTRQLRVL